MTTSSTWNLKGWLHFDPRFWPSHETGSCDARRLPARAGGSLAGAVMLGSMWSCQTSTELCRFCSFPEHFGFPRCLWDVGLDFLEAKHIERKPFDVDPSCMVVLLGHLIVPLTCVSGSAPRSPEAVPRSEVATSFWLLRGTSAIRLKCDEMRWNAFPNKLVSFRNTNEFPSNTKLLVQKAWKASHRRHVQVKTREDWAGALGRQLDSSTGFVHCTICKDWVTWNADPKWVG